MGGLLQGLSDGFSQAQERELRRQTLKVQQDHSKAQLKAFEAEDQMKQLQIQSLKSKLTAQDALPGMQQDLMGSQPQQEDSSITTLKNLLGDRPNEPLQIASQPTAAPEIDRNKLVTLLQTAQRAGQDPDQLLSIMSMADPRIKAIQDSLKPETFTKLGEGDTLISNKTRQPVAAGATKKEKPISVAPGGTLVDPSTGEVKFMAPQAPPKPPDFGDRTESAATVYGQHKYGRPMTFTELLSIDPIQAAKIRQQTMVEEPATIQAGILAAKIPEKKAELLTTGEANDLGVPFGTTRGEAEGIMPITAQQRAAIASFDTARTIIADIKQYSEKVNTSSAGLKGRAAQGMKLWGAWTQSDPDAAMLQSKAGELASIARSMGEKGALADKDVARASALIPDVMDTREIAQKKLFDMSKIIDEGEASLRKSLGIDARTPAASKKAEKPAKPAAQQPKEDPLASIPVPKGLSPQQEQVYRKAYAEEKSKKQQQMKPKEKAKK